MPRQTGRKAPRETRAQFDAEMEKFSRSKEWRLFCEVAEKDGVDPNKRLEELILRMAKENNISVPGR